MLIERAHTSRRNLLVNAMLTITPDYGNTPDYGKTPETSGQQSAGNARSDYERSEKEYEAALRSFEVSLKDKVTSLQQSPPFLVEPAHQVCLRGRMAAPFELMSSRNSVTRQKRNGPLLRLRTRPRLVGTYTAARESL